MQSCTHSSFLAKYRKVINDDRVKLHLMKGSIPPSLISNHRTSTGFKLIQSSVENTFGFLCAPNLCIGNTDTRWYWGLSESIFRFSPMALTMKETSMFHGFNERLVDFYKEIILNWTIRRFLSHIMQGIR